MKIDNFDAESKYSLGDLRLGVKVINENGELQSKVVEYSKEEQIVRADAGYYALEQVTIPAVSGEFDVASVYNEDGTQDIYISDEGELNIEEPLQTKNVIPNIQVQEIVADEDYYALGKVVVEAVTSSIDENIKPENIKQGVSILGVQGIMQEPPFDSKFAQLINGTLASVTPEDLKGVSTLKSYIFQGQKNLQSVKVPDGITNIGTYAFQGCTALEELDLSNVGGTIAYACFNGLSNLKSLNLKNITGAAAVANDSVGFILDCTQLTDINLENYSGTANKLMWNSAVVDLRMPKLTAVGDRAFSNNTKLKSIYLKAVTYIGGRYTFSGCSVLEKFVVANKDAIVTMSFSTSPLSKIPYFYVPLHLTTTPEIDNVATYRKATNWVTYASYIFPLIDSVDDLNSIDTSLYTRCCIENDNLDVYLYDGTTWNKE